jgi:SpoVK/Ycf46/Vps4 family AAA+-type ATPase
LHNFNLAQRLGAGICDLVLFDELEDLLPRAEPWQSRGRAHKGWICEVLEGARIPTVWTCNSIQGIDAAILRRFSLVLEVPVPPRSVRRALLGKALAKHDVSESWCDRIARLDYLTPAMIAQFEELAEALPPTTAAREQALDRWLAEQLKAMGRQLPLPSNDGVRFRSSWLNVDAAPDRLIEGLRKIGVGRLLLHGPPGTGKSAFAQHLAEQLDLPAMARRGSDLRSMWVGETERNVAGIFEQAEREGALLILDEAESFLSHRENRRQRWELNEATEFLVRLENFQGIFCATTNRPQDIDVAFMRRFDLKLRFGYLDSGQREACMRQALRDLGCPSRLSKRTRTRLAEIEELTPGDFVVVRRRLRLAGESVTQAGLLSALVHEVSCKNFHRSRPIGFRPVD